MLLQFKIFVVILSGLFFVNYSWPADDVETCRGCHDQEKLSAAQFGKSVHKDIQCVDCHAGFTVPDGTENPPGHGKSKSEALNSCSNCHADSLGKTDLIVHAGQATSPNSGLPFCLDCHGDPHMLKAMSSQMPTERREAMSERCLVCHDDGGEKVSFPALQVGAVKEIRKGRIAETFEHSVHGRKLHLGSDKAPGCADCHGGHVQNNLKTDRIQVCTQCHQGVTTSFGTLVDHEPYTWDKKPVSFVTIKFFALLTFLTIFGLCLHVGLDLFATLRRRLKGLPIRPSHDGPDAHKTVERFDIHQRIQHGLMALSFTTLVITGWPLSGTKVSSSHEWVKIFGGIDGAGLIHRGAAVILVFVSLYHLVYLLMLGRKKTLRFSMIPMPKDIVDAFHNILYFLSLRKEPPKFARFSYVEKFDYWAVFWGMFIMAGSGFLRWFPEAAAKYLPTWVYEIGLHAHTDEALLAAMAIFLWHFYNVHLRPGIFPMSKVFLHGKLTIAELKHEHPLEYEELVRTGKIRE